MLKLITFILAAVLALSPTVAAAAFPGKLYYAPRKLAKAKTLGLQTEHFGDYQNPDWGPGGPEQYGKDYFGYALNGMDAWDQMIQGWILGNLGAMGGCIAGANVCIQFGAMASAPALIPTCCSAGAALGITSGLIVNQILIEKDIGLRTERVVRKPRCYIAFEARLRVKSKCFTSKSKALSVLWNMENDARRIYDR